MSEDYYVDSNTPCPNCKYSFTRYSECYAECEDGHFTDFIYDGVNEYDEDKICAACNGKGYERWCPACLHEF